MSRRRWTALPPKALRPPTRPRGILLAIVGATKPEGGVVGSVVVPAYRRIPLMAFRVGVTDKWDQAGWIDLRTYGQEIWGVPTTWPFHYTDGLEPMLMVDERTREAVEVRLHWNQALHRRRPHQIKIHHEAKPRTAREREHVKRLRENGSRLWNHPPKWGKKRHEYVG